MYKSILKQYWGYDSFRGIQQEIIESIGSGRDTLGLMPTGGGKSITFQVPAMAMKGVCVVITPLIALMKDQVMHLRQKGILATAIYSGMSHKEILTALENCILGDTKFLYVSPERLGTSLFRTKFSRMNVSFITIDEAHCISQWGYDFRPSYLQIAEIRKIKPDVAVLALTATATPTVVDDIQERLQFRKKNVFRMSFRRQNLAYVVRKAEDKEAELIHILSSVQGSAIVYVRSRKGTKDIALLLNDNGLKATYYHAGLDHSVKDLRQHQWQNDEIRIMVATNAFGMGIDKPDVRVVVHIDSPDSIEAYFQEAGRAGRDGKKAYAVLLFNHLDETKLHRRIGDTYPNKDFIKNVYERLAYFYQIAMGTGIGHTHIFDITKFCMAYHYFPVLVDSALKILDNAGYIEYETDPDNEARVMFLLDRQQLYMLEQLTPNQELVITTLMRCYGGLFTDYVYIDLSFLEIHSGLTKQQLYLVLKSLSKRRILHFIPQRTMPFITYARDREDISLMTIPPQVYEQRKEQMEIRIKAMTEYAISNDKCRSQMLLEYFGEDNSEECRQCDVCIDKNTAMSAKRSENAIEAIRDLLKDKMAHDISELRTLTFPTPQINEALSSLVNEEIILVNDSKIILNK